ncbi:hypothetical protein ABL78_1851 [Leptomonas seymouri]|uniref:non-specific serine/threonine protein kinase n=1 Tax=Leptomonas seymouri TaxID=5684 RepID=A0A0N1I038_LEPSE|nr:hypothetical protein ABL78_1851 [Leptomonas seymouri]|eukprot:KPI89038.1 hypothetical protein ABL78_1851 [Leptomonas seymouri]
MSDLPLWPRYRPIRVIGQGGFGTVYLCEDTEPTSSMYRQQVAVKATLLNALSDEEVLMVMSEVSLLKNIDHPNILKCFDSFLHEEAAEGGENLESARASTTSQSSRPRSGAAGGRGCERKQAASPAATAQWLCLVTEYVDGGDLSSLIRKYTDPKKRPGKDGRAEHEGEGFTLSSSVSGEVRKPAAALPSQPSQTLEGTLSDMFRWSSASSDAEAAAAYSRPLLKGYCTPTPSMVAAAVTVEMPRGGQHKRYRSAGDKEGGEASTREGERNDWERLSSQHRRRLASTLRLGEQPCCSPFSAVSTHSGFAAFSAAATKNVIPVAVMEEGSDNTADGAALGSWISDASAAMMPRTPLGATELERLTHLGKVDPLQASPMTTQIEGRTAVTAAAGAGAPCDMPSSSHLEAQLPPDPNQLWIESFLIADIAKQCLDALAYLHALGILHRDIKPSNIYLFKKDGTVKIGDFGVSKLLQPSIPFATTFVGTPFYLSPELCMGDPYSFGADVWALGVLLYELYCLKLPFVADNVLGQIYVITEGTYDRAALRRPHAFAETQRAVLEELYGPSFAQSEVLLHGLVVEMVEQMLTVDPAQRPLAEVLLSGVFGCGSTLARAGSSAGTSAVPTPMHRPPSADLLPCYGAKLSNNTNLINAKINSADAKAEGVDVAVRAGDRHSSRSNAVGSAEGPQTGRLGPLASYQHARWASSLVQAASVALSGGNSSGGMSGCPAAELTFSKEPTPAPPSRRRSSPLLTALGESSSWHSGAVNMPTEPLAIKVKQSMLGILQGMRCEQRERLESCAAGEAAYDAQRLRNVAALSPPATAKPATAPAAVPTGQRQLSACGSVADCRQLQLLQPAIFSRNELCSSDGVARTAELPLQATDSADFVMWASFAAKMEGDAAAAATPTFTLPSNAETADSFDRLIGADTRDELSAFLGEVPWLQNADVFSAIPLFAGSDDVMFVARAGHRRNSNSDSSGVPGAMKKREGSEEARVFGSGRPGSSMRSTVFPSNVQLQQYEGIEAQHRDEESPHPPTPAVRYAGSVSRSHPNIEVVPMPQSYPQRQRASIVGAVRAERSDGAQQPRQESRCALQYNEGVSAWEQRRVSHSFSSGVAAALGSSPPSPVCAVSAASARQSSGGRHKPPSRCRQASLTAVASVAAIVSSALAPSAGNRNVDGRHDNRSHQNNDTGRSDEGEENQEEVPVAATVATACGGSGVLRLRLSSMRLHREGSAVGARLRPISAARSVAENSATTGANDFKSSAIFSQEAKKTGGSSEVDGALPLKDFDSQGGLHDSIVTPLPAEHAFPPTPLNALSPPPPTPKVHTAGRCEGFSTSELEALLRAKLLAHHAKRQRGLRAQRAEMAEQEAARAAMRQKLRALFSSAYKARAGSASPDTICETASYHSTRTYDQIRSADEGTAAGDSPLSLARKLTMPCTPEESCASFSNGQTPRLPVSRQPPSARLPSPTATTTTSRKSPLLIHASPDALSLDRTARQAVREEEVLRALSARHTAENTLVSTAAQANNVGLGSDQPADATPMCAPTYTISADRWKSPISIADNKNYTVFNSSSGTVEPDLLTATPAVRLLRQAASLAAAVERQKAEFRNGKASPVHIQVTPAWRPPYDSKDVPGLWETSSAEGEEETDARGRPGRPTPVHVREELRWRWSAPPTDADSADEEEEEEEQEGTAESSVSSAELQCDDQSWDREHRLHMQGGSTSQRHADDETDADVAECAAGLKETSKHGEVTTMCADEEREDREAEDGELQQQSSLFDSTTGLVKASVEGDLLSQPEATSSEEGMQSSHSEQSSEHLHNANNEPNTDWRRSKSNSNAKTRGSAKRSGSGSDDASSRRQINSTSPSGDVDWKHTQRPSKKQQGQRRSKRKRNAEEMSNSSADVSSETASSPSRSSSSSSTTSSSSSSDGDSSEESEEDMSYAYTVQVDAETSCRFFDYVCPVTIELVGELPAACRVATRAQMLTGVLHQPPGEPRLTPTMDSTGLADLTSTDLRYASSSPKHRGVDAPVPSTDVDEGCAAQKIIAKQQPPQQPFLSSTAGTLSAVVNEDGDHSSLEGSSKSSLFEDCSLLSLSSISSPHVAQEATVAVTTDARAGDVADAYDKRENGSSAQVLDSLPALAAPTPSTTPQRSSPGAGDAAPKSQKASGRPAATKGNVHSSPTTQQHADSMLVVGTRVPATSLPLTPSTQQRVATLSEAPKAKPPAIAEMEIRQKPSRKSSAPPHRTTSRGAQLSCNSPCGRVWRIRVPPLPSLASTSDTKGLPSTAAAAPHGHIALPVSIALRLIRKRTRLVGLLWRLWTAALLVDPALRRVILGGDRCKGAGGACTFAEAFGDWARGDSGEDSNTTTTPPGSTTDATATMSSRTSNPEVRLTSAKASRPSMRAVQNSNCMLELPSSDTVGAAVTQDTNDTVSPSNADRTSSQGRRWSLYYVEPCLKAAVRLQTDDDWAVVRHKVEEMGQLLPFIRLYMVLHDAELTPSQ